MTGSATAFHRIGIGIYLVAMDENKLREFISKQNWIFAKTYANKAPHEYIVRGRISGTDEEFMSVINYIQEDGIAMHYGDHLNRYIFVDRHQYWVMRDGEDDPTMGILSPTYKDKVHRR